MITDKRLKYLRRLISRILLSIILFLVIGILIKINTNNKSIINKHLFKNSISFTKINNWYQNNFGKIIPDMIDKTNLVFNETYNIEYTQYKDGIKINYPKNNPIKALNGGIVIFKGDDEVYGKTIIIQGNDGIDYWYSNIDNTNYNLYDYIETNSIIGESISDYIYLVLQKDGNYLKYDEYIKENKD